MNLMMLNKKKNTTVLIIYIKPAIEPNSCLHLSSSFSSTSKHVLKPDFLAVWQWTESLYPGFLWDPSVLSHSKRGQHKPIFDRFILEYRLGTGKYLAREMKLFLYKFILSNCSDEQLIKLYKDKKHEDCSSHFVCLKCESPFKISLYIAVGQDHLTICKQV